LTDSTTARRRATAFSILKERATDVHAVLTPVSSLHLEEEKTIEVVNGCAARTGLFSLSREKRRTEFGD